MKKIRQNLRSLKFRIKDLNFHRRSLQSILSGILLIALPLGGVAEMSQESAASSGATPGSGAASRPEAALVANPKATTDAEGNVISNTRATKFIRRTEQRLVRHRLFPNAEADEALIAQAHGNLTSSDLETFLNGSNEDYFADMDYGITQSANAEGLVKTLTPFFPGITAQEATKRVARGRNLWMVWTGGNDRFWNYLSRATFGGFDLLKTISSQSALVGNRDNRWTYYGLLNEPCFKKPTGPRADRWGLWIDERGTGCQPDPYEDQTRYPGIKVGARGQKASRDGKPFTLDTGSFYGYATGIVGLRLFPNPDFDQRAIGKWDAKRYYEDPTYYNDPNLVRPYRVGMACAFCHAGPNPVLPPKDFENPEWRNITGNVGSQYYWVDRIFVWDQKHSSDNFFYQLLHTARPGTVDTSLVSSDQINNPRTMNAIYNLSARMQAAMKFNDREKLVRNERLNMQFDMMSPTDLPMSSVLRSMVDNKAKTVVTPRVLKDGSDSVGPLGALNRVYINIGLFSEEWMQNFIPMIGGVVGMPITPISLTTLTQRSLYWNATVNQTPDLALYLLAASRPDKLREAPGGDQYLKPLNDPTVVAGKAHFAENCAQCHSSKLPEKAYSFFQSERCMGEGYLTCWNAYSAYVQTPEFKDEMRKIVLAPDFLNDNYLSTDLRVPSNLIDDQLCSPVATNAIAGSVWDNFSADSYKHLPSVGKFTVNFPANDMKKMVSEEITVPAGGRGYMRPPSLASLWSTAPFLVNNSLGFFDERGTVEGRMRSFDDSIQKLLNPELRGQGVRAGEHVMTYTTSFGDSLPGIVDVTTSEAYFKLPRGYLPKRIFDYIQKALGDDRTFAKSMWHHEHSYRPVASHEAPELLARAVIRDPVYVIGQLGASTKVDAALNRAPEIQNEVTKASQIVPMAIAESRAIENEDDASREIATDVAFDYKMDSASLYSDKELGDYILLGPIPAGIPVNMITGMNLEKNPVRLSEAIYGFVKGAVKVRREKLKGQAATDAFMALAGSPMMRVANCKDFVVNRGHYFGSKFSPFNKKSGKPGLNDQERLELVEFLKQM